MAAYEQYDGYSNNTGTPDSTIECTLESVNQGSLLVAVISRYCNFAVRQAGSISDSQGNTWSQIESPGGWYDAGNTDFQMFYAENVASGSTAVSATWVGTGSGYEQLIVAEFSGAATSGSLIDSEVLDTEGTASTTPVTGTATATAAGQIAVAGFQTASWAVDPGVSGSWTKIVDFDNGLTMAYQILGASGNVSGTWTLSSAYAYLGSTAVFDVVAESSNRKLLGLLGIG